MKLLQYILVFFFIILVSSLSSQNQLNNQTCYKPLWVIPNGHDPNFRDFPEKSFYESRNNWQAIIDSTWGPGLPTADKLLLFDQYATALQNEFDGFLSLGMDWFAWESFRNYYRNQINDSTSRGGFSAIVTRLTCDLKDAHTYAYDLGIVQSELNPGVPLLVNSNYFTIEHFGAVTTALSDSSTLVLRVVPNHPLGLQPGDIIIGYDGVPWKTLVYELIAAGLPLMDGSTGSASAISDFAIIPAGMNWHLFNTMDIYKHATGDTLHLPVAPMINLNLPPMLNNEQIEIQGIPFPTFFNNQLVSYGILNNTNIGYIYLFSEWPTTSADQQFAEAVNALRNTKGLIIDMRLNFGGWALFDDAFDILFNDFAQTIESAYRLSPTELTLLPSGNAHEFQIDSDRSSLYDRPIAILLGPTCISMGDVTAQRFRYHPTVKFFGKPPGASLGFNLDITNVPDWYFRYSISDQFHVFQPNNYLNRSEFPIDFPVWHNPSDVANGVDAVVETAKNWINSMIYAHRVKPSQSFINPIIDTLNITAHVTNPPNHNLQVAAIINTLDSVLVDSLPMFDDGNHGDSLAGDGLYGCYSNPFTTEDVFSIDASITDLDSSHYHILTQADRFTTAGPVVVNHYEIPQISSNFFQLRLFLKNEGLNATATEITTEIFTTDTNVTNILPIYLMDFGNIEPGEIKTSSIPYTIFTQNNPANIDFSVNISSDRWEFWSDSFTVVVTGILVKATNIPKEYQLSQNYPNPFNPSTTIEFDLPKTSEVTLKVFNILGEEVATIVSDRLSTGSYSYEWDAGKLASGVYLYRLQAGNYVQTRKMVLMK